MELVSSHRAMRPKALKYEGFFHLLVVSNLFFFLHLLKRDSKMLLLFIFNMFYPTQKHYLHRVRNEAEKKKVLYSLTE